MSERRDDTTCLGGTVERVRVWPVHVQTDARGARRILALRAGGQFTDRQVTVFGGGDVFTVACCSELYAGFVRDELSCLA